MATSFKVIPHSILLGFCLCLTPIGSTQDPQKDQVAETADEGVHDKIESLINAHIKSPLPFNGSVLVAHKGEVVYRGAFGDSAPNSKTKNTVDSKYFIGSITKQYTTVSILQLVQQGKLSLEDKLSKWLPQITGADKITLHHLLTHQSGLARDAAQPYDADVSAFERALSLKDTALSFEPGEEERYSNLGFYALTHILQEVSGQPYEEYFSKNIFVPAGMENTGVRHDKDEVIPGLSVGIGMAPDEFGVNDFGPAKYFDSYSLSGGGSLYSTIDDEFKFFTALENGTLLPMDVVKEMKKRWPVTGKSRDDLYHSYGWEARKFRGTKIFGFTGKIHGYVSAISYYEDTDILVVILCNNNFSNRELVAWGIELIVRYKKFGRGPAGPTIPKNIAITEAMKKHVGEYDYPKEKTTVNIKIINGKMTLQSHGDAPIYLYAEDENTFYSDLMKLTIKFKITPREQTQYLMFNYEDSMVDTLSRIDTGTISKSVVNISPTDENIRYTGRWNFDDPEVPWLAWTGASIMVKFQGTGIAIEIDPRGKTEQYRTIIDGVPEEDRWYFSSGKQTYQLASDLSDGPHTLELMRETAFKTYRSLFYGFTVTGTGLLPLPARPAFRIEFFGDSNMNGYNNYREKNNSEVGTYYAFPAMVTRMLGAEMHNQSRGGAAIADEGDNHVKHFIYAQEYMRAPGVEHEPRRPYQGDFAPHIIVIGAGGNDIAFSNDKSVIKSRYKSVIAELRKVYGAEPKIILFNRYGRSLKETARYTHEVVEELGDPNLSVCNFPWLMDTGHGSQWDHSGQAHVLVDHIAALNPDWKQKNAPDIVDGFGRNWDFANGSFEHQAPFGGFGWPYSEDGVERVHDSAGAADGEYYIRLEEDEKVQQITDATGDLKQGVTSAPQTYFIRAMIRGVDEGAQAQIITEFRDEQWLKPGKPQTTTFKLTTSWQVYKATATAPADTCTLINTLRASAGTVEFDDVRMSNKPFAEKSSTR